MNFSLKNSINTLKPLRDKGVTRKIAGILSLHKPALDGDISKNKENLKKFLRKTLLKQGSKIYLDQGNVCLINDLTYGICLRIRPQRGSEAHYLQEKETLEAIQGVYNQIIIDIQDEQKIQNYFDEQDLHSVTSLPDDAQAEDLRRTKEEIIRIKQLYHDLQKKDKVQKAENIMLRKNVEEYKEQLNQAQIEIQSKDREIQTLKDKLVEQKKRQHLYAVYKNRQNKYEEKLIDGRQLQDSPKVLKKNFNQKVLVLENDDEVSGLIQVLKGEKQQILYGSDKPEVLLPVHRNSDPCPEFKSKETIGLKRLLKKDLQEIEMVYINYGTLGNKIQDINVLANLRNLEGFALDSNQLGNQGLIKLLDNNLVNLKFLHLCDNSISSTGAQVLAKSNLVNLTKLTLDDNDIGDEGLAEFQQSTLINLEELWLYNNQISEKGAIALSKSNLFQLKILALDENQIGDEGLIALSDGNLMNLERLSLTENRITDFGIEALCQGRLNKLRILGLDHNQIGDRGVNAFLKSNLSRLTELWMRGNIISSESLVLLKNSRDWKKLRVDNLNYCVYE